jgi:hypothetical protein
MRTATSVFVVRAFSQGLNESHVSSKTDCRSFSVSGFNASIFASINGSYPPPRDIAFQVRQRCDTPGAERRKTFVARNIFLANKGYVGCFFIIGSNSKGMLVTVQRHHPGKGSRHNVRNSSNQCSGRSRSSSVPEVRRANGACADRG